MFKGHDVFSNFCATCVIDIPEKVKKWTFLLGEKMCENRRHLDVNESIQMKKNQNLKMISNEEMGC
jgi:hypothetical protein